MVIRQFNLGAPIEVRRGVGWSGGVGGETQTGRKKSFPPASDAARRPINWFGDQRSTSDWVRKVFPPQTNTRVQSVELANHAFQQPGTRLWHMQIRSQPTQRFEDHTCGL